jgi:hypothetical protein
MSELGKLGITVKRVTETSSTSVSGLELSSNTHTKVTMTLPRPTKLKATFSPESTAKKIIKIFKKELQTGDPHFDDEIYISTDTPEETKAFLDEEVRNAIGFVVTTGGPCEIHGDTLVVCITGDDQSETNEMLMIARAVVAFG